jgi:predicted amidohydrolase
MRKFLLLALLLCAQFAFANGHHSGANGHHSGIAGHVILVICPVVGPEGCPTRPYQGQFAIYNSKDKLIAEITPDAEGFFVVDLKPGTYTIVPKAPEPPHIWPFGYPFEVQVVLKEYTPVTVVFGGP